MFGYAGEQSSVCIMEPAIIPSSRKQEDPRFFENIESIANWALERDHDTVASKSSEAFVVRSKENQDPDSLIQFKQVES